MGNIGREMAENFDCTQFLTFDCEDINEIHSKIYELFKGTIFSILSSDEIRTVKKKYLEKYTEKYIFELKHDEFIGEFEDWHYEDKPPILIQEFISTISILLDYNLKKFKIILIKFAEEDYTSDKFIKINISQMKQGLFNMSLHNYDVSEDNLILEIEALLP